MLKLRTLLALRRRAHWGGQIATLLLILLVGILILALATANLGHVSQTSITVANAADSSALSLGSQLSTQANVLCMSLGNGTECKTERCRRRGILAIVLAVVAAVVAIILIIPSGGVSMVALPGILSALHGAIALTFVGAVAGAAAGALGGAIAGTGVLKGAFQGASIGAAIGGGIGAFAGSGSTATAAGTSVGKGSTVSVELTTPGFVGNETTIVANTAMKIGDTVSVSLGGAGQVTGTVIAATVAPSMSGAIIGGALAVGSGIANAVLEDMLTADAFAAMAKSISGLPDYDRYREGTFFHAFSQVVDDPNRVTDTPDSDRDDDRTEQVPAFQVWWDQRIKDLKAGFAATGGSVAQFLANTLTPFREQSEIFRGVEQDENQVLGRQEIEGQDGSAVKVWRAIRNDPAVNVGGPAIRFWEPGPDSATLSAWADCEACADQLPQGYDEVDAAHTELQQLEDMITGLEQMAEQGTTESYESWLPWFYDPASDGDFSDTLTLIANGGSGTSGISGWISDTTAVRNQLRRCKLAWVNETQFSNSLCKVYPADRTSLLSQIATVQSRIDALPAYISDSDNLASILGITLCSEGATSNIQISNIKAALEDAPTVLKYSFDYAYDCTGISRSCSDGPKSGGACSATSTCPSCSCSSTAPDPACTRTTGTPSLNSSSCTNPCTYACGTVAVPSTCNGRTGSCNYARTDTFSCPHSGSGSKTASITAPDLRIASPQMSTADFSSALTAFQTTLNNQGSQAQFATIDADAADEFKPALDELGSERGTINDFVSDVQAFANTVGNVQGSKTDGAGSAAYSWRDSRGEHQVTIETGPFKIAKLEREKRGNFLVGKICMVLKEYTESGSRAWVRIIRKDTPHAGQQMRFWKWNPFSGTVTKRASVSYTQTTVGLAGR